MFALQRNPNSVLLIREKGGNPMHRESKRRAQSRGREIGCEIPRPARGVWVFTTSVTELEESKAFEIFYVWHSSIKNLQHHNLNLTWIASRIFMMWEVVSKLYEAVCSHCILFRKVKRIATWCSNWILHRTLKYSVCCLIDPFPFFHWDISRTNMSICGVKYSWTTL